MLRVFVFRALAMPSMVLRGMMISPCCGGWQSMISFARMWPSVDTMVRLFCLNWNSVPLR